MNFAPPHPFGLSLSKATPSFALVLKKRQGFDRLSPNGFGDHG
jgi:hypothetical protein